MQNVLITLISAGSDTGPFDLYSNANSYTVPFEIGVSKAALLAGYTSSLVPDAATIIRVKSTGTCTNNVDLSIVTTTTTTSTTTTTTSTTTTTTTTPDPYFYYTATFWNCLGGCTLASPSSGKIRSLSPLTFGYYYDTGGGPLAKVGASTFPQAYLHEIPVGTPGASICSAC